MPRGTTAFRGCAPEQRSHCTTWCLRRLETTKARPRRHPRLFQGARGTEFSYIRDPDYGDEAYDLRSDPSELVNLLGAGGQEPAEVAELRRRVDRWEDDCMKLRDRLGVVPGFRGFDQ